MFRIFLTGVVLFLASTALGQTLNGTVEGVVDGDTFLIFGSGRTTTVSLTKVDCPELGQEGADQAKAFAEQTLRGKEVRVNLKSMGGAEWPADDIVFGNRESFSLAIVAKGFGWIAPEQAQNPAMTDALLAAMANKAGIWAQANPVAPWEYRALHPIETPATPPIVIPPVSTKVSIAVEPKKEDPDSVAAQKAYADLVYAILPKSVLESTATVRTVPSIGMITVAWNLKPNFTNKMMLGSGKMRVVEVLKAIQASKIPYELVCVEGSYPLVDVYGNENLAVVMRAVFPRTEIDKVQWQNFDFDDVFNLQVEQLKIHPAFLK